MAELSNNLPAQPQPIADMASSPLARAGVRSRTGIEDVPVYLIVRMMRGLDPGDVLLCRLLHTAWGDADMCKKVAVGNAAFNHNREWVHLPIECLMTYTRLFGRALTRLAFDYCSGITPGNGGHQRVTTIPAAVLRGVLQDCPNVTTVYFRDIQLDSSHLDVLHSHPRVTDITFMHDCINNTVDPQQLLKAVRNLTRLVFRPGFEYEHLPSVADILQAAPQLEHLHFDGDCPSNGHRLWDALVRAPHENLRSLCIACVDLRDHHMIQLAQLQLKVVEFPVALHYVTPNRFLEFVEAMPTLCTATFDGVDEVWYDDGPPEEWIEAQAILTARRAAQG